MIASGRLAWWSGAGSNCRPSAFQALFRADSTLHNDESSSLLTAFTLVGGLM
jgi:hypothetical protein